jgi:hypothetical protein
MFRISFRSCRDRGEKIALAFVASNEGLRWAALGMIEG